MYSVAKGRVEATIELSHGRMSFELALGHGTRGVFNRLALERHQQQMPGGAWFDHSIPEGQDTFAFVDVRAWA